MTSPTSSPKSCEPMWQPKAANMMKTKVIPIRLSSSGAWWGVALCCLTLLGSSSLLAQPAGAEPSVQAQAVPLIAQASQNPVAPAVAPTGTAASAKPAVPPAEPTLTPVKDRLTDQIIARDLQSLRAMQSRLEAVNRNGTPIENYQFCKAQRWLDFSVDTYADNDRSGVITEALTESHKIASAMEAAKGPLPAGSHVETRLLPTSERVREDLWQLAETLKKAPGFRCSQCAVGKLEVQLVWAGHERKQLGWRHAKPFLQAAERYAREAQNFSDNCTPLTVASAPPPPPVMPPPAVVKQLEVLADRVHFAYNKSNISRDSATVLDRIASILRTYPGVQIDLLGHADQRGSERYNLKLSRNRAEAVKGYLVAAGVPSTRMNVKALGKAQPEVNATTNEAYAKNRRVVFVMTMGDGVQLKSQGGDLQLEPDKKGKASKKRGG